MTFSRRLVAELLGTALLLAVVVTLSAAVVREFAWRDVGPYVIAQIAGAFLGVAAAHLMFGLPLYSVSQHVRAGPAQWWSEVVATTGLMLTIVLGLRQGPRWVAGLVAAYITAAYWFTASTSFANPAVTLARSMTDTFAGIRPSDVPGFVVAEIVAAIGATYLARWFSRSAHDACDN